MVACLLLPHARADARLRASCVALLVRELCAPGGSAAAALMAQLRAAPDFPPDIFCELLEASTLRGGAAAHKRMRIE